jgi:hypothetical protein
VDRGGDPVLAWYAAATTTPTYADPTTPWQVWAARATTERHQALRFVLAQVSATPVHFGPLCMFPTCGGDHTGLADFLTVAVDSTDAVVVAYADNGRQGTSPMPYLRVARPRAEAAPGHGRGNGRGHDQGRGNGHGPGDPVDEDDEPTGDAPVGTLDLASLPGVVDGRHLSFSLASGRDLPSALSAGPGGRAHDAYWLLLWHTPPHVYYAVMHVSTDGAPEFYGGVDPAPVNNLGQSRQLVATYPAAVPLSGTVDPSSGAVVIDISGLQLAPGTTLHDVQAFTMTGTGAPVTQLSMLDVVDASPSTTLTLPAL